MSPVAWIPERIDPEIILQSSTMLYSPSRISSREAPTTVLTNLGLLDNGPEIEIVLLISI